MANKVEKVEGKDLSTNDFTNREKAKLNTIELNAQENKIEKIKIDGVEQEIKDKIVNLSTSALINIFYPVGSYYETSDTSFDPNKSWSGTWVLEEDGTVLVSKSSTSGSKFNSDIGTIVGNETHKLAIEELPNSVWSSGGQTGGVNALFSAGNSYGIQTLGTNLNQAHNNVQPSKIVKRWHRTA